MGCTMELQDILPITSISLMAFGFIIILIGFIWMANTISNEESTAHFSNTEDIIGEMNQMFTYFTNKIDNKHKRDTLKEDTCVNDYRLENAHYTKVLESKKQGKTPDQIAKELNMGKGEVNLILGIDQMR